MQALRHWGPRYIRDRLAVMSYQRMHPDAPWLTAHAISILSTWIKPTDAGPEWGSGRSTVWFARRAQRSPIAGRDAQWGANVPAMLAQAGLGDKVEYYVFPDGTSESSSSHYVRVIDEFAPESLDFVLVDGVCRDHCALACLDKLKPGGLVIVDNVNWYVARDPKSRAPNSRGLENGPASGGWELFASRVNSWRLVWTTNGLWDTAFWVKPSAENTL